jgi:hypothetical protein
MKRAPPTVVLSGEVVQVRPALLNVRSAAVYAAVSPGLLNALRASDVKARAAGQVPTGPDWVVLGGSMVRYRVTSLDDWIARASIPLGTVDSRRRPTEPAAEAEAAP